MPWLRRFAHASLALLLASEAVAASVVFQWRWREIPLPPLTLTIDETAALSARAGMGSTCAIRSPLACCVVLLCGGVLPGDMPRADGLIELFGGAEEFWTVAQAERIEVAVISSGNGATNDTPRRKLTPAEVRRLRTMLTCDAAYDWNAPAELGWEPTHRLTFFHRGREVSIELTRDGPDFSVITARGPITASFAFGFHVLAPLLPADAVH